MVNVGSLSATGNTVFNLDTQAGITHLLASIRISDINTEHKSELRDLVFLYTNGGKDQTVRLALEQKITAYQLAPAPQKVTAAVLPPPPAIGTYRRAPSFQASSPNTTPVQPVNIPAPQQNFTAAPVWQAAPVVPVPVAAVVPPPVAPPTLLPVTPAPPVSLPATPTIAADDQQYLKRIREIKALVNERVGNPVNLVDINNDVGREYMGALLDAMKKLNSGSSAASAMQRLEDSFVAVEAALKEHDQAASIPVVEAVKPAPITPTPVPAVPEPVFEPEPTPVRIVSIPTPANVTPITQEPLQKVFVTRPPEQPISESATITEDVPSPKTGKLYVETVPPPVYTPPQPLEPISSWPVEEVKPSASQAPFAPLSDSKQKLPAPHDAPSATTLKTTATAGDSLFNKEVDDGLQQLLLEWPIFKKSGLFGTGPKGREHPLFKKMAPLQIPLLLAGRFEGATQETKQSVTDYMNGWRYEQGLIYQQAETFEHYLRRVIRHILDLQKGK